MKKMQRNKPVRIAAVLLVLMLVTTVALTGTLARYTSTATASSQYVRVAAWNVEISFDGTTWMKFNDARVAQNLLLLGPTTNLLTHALIPAQEAEAGVAGPWTDAETLATSQLHNSAYDFGGDTPDFLVHPGIGGYVNFFVRNMSEVPATLAIDVGTATIAAQLGTVIDVAFKTTGGAITSSDFAGLTWGKNFNATGLATGAGSSGVIPADGTATQVGIAWKWDFGALQTALTDCTGTVLADPCDSAAVAGVSYCSLHGAPNTTAALDGTDTALGMNAAGFNADGTAIVTPAAIAAALSGAKIVVAQLD